MVMCDVAQAKQTAGAGIEAYHRGQPTTDLDLQSDAIPLNQVRNSSGHKQVLQVDEARHYPLQF
jgi:hypothetical protein